MATTDSGPIDRPLSHEVEGLRHAECWEVLASLSLGRLAVLGLDGAPDIFPVDYLTHEEQIYVRTAPGSKLMDVAHDPRVAFEVDAVGDELAWSVVVRGTAVRLDADDEIEASGVLELQSTNPTVKSNFLRITPREITGRRFRTVRD
ncbi:pyridoxamine 5'-phosphate oxidase family protein [Microbacterium sp.]|uniref:pyridoxamine 5'-phosphate oxidase family protein n=1 Tax=Microbacterium sp. TaxID=51671 RepID=UPI0039E4CACD